MTTSRIPAVIAYLVTAFTASSLLGAATPPVSIYDGPPVPEENPDLALYVGLADFTSGAPAADGTQAWAALGHQARNEQITIHCLAAAWSGDDIPGARAAVYAITSAAEDIVRNDASLGGTVSTPGNAAVTATSLTQAILTEGFAARVAFDITAQARIGG